MAGVLVGLQAVVGLVVAGVLVARSVSSELGVGPVLAEAGMFAVIGLTLGAVAVGLWTGRPLARTPAIVAQLLLLPVVYYMIGSQLLLGLAAGAVVFAAFMLLISEPSRAWAVRTYNSR